MDRDRIRQAAMGKRKRPGASAGGGAWARRLIIYGGLLTLLLAKVLFDQLSQEEVVERPAAPLEPFDVPAFESEPRARIDPALLADVRDETPGQRAQLERAARVHLLEEASTLIWGDLEKLGLKEGDHDAVSREPETFRGRPIWALGTIRWMDQAFFDGLLEVRGEIADASGRSWLFLVVTEPYDIEPGDVVRVPGFFFKNARMLRPDGEFADAPLIVGEELRKSAFRFAPVTSLDSNPIRGRLRRVRDLSIDGASQPYTSRTFYELLSFARHGPDEAFFPEAQLPPDITPISLLKKPRDWRAEPVRVTGRLLDARRVPLGPLGENPLGVKQVHELWLNDGRAGEAGNILVLMLDDPAAGREPFTRGDILEVDGLFFRRWAYENKLNEPRMAALVVGRRAQEYEVPGPVLGDRMLRIIVWGVGGLALLLFFAQWRDKRAARGARSQRMKRKARLIERGETPSAPPESEASPEGSAP